MRFNSIIETIGNTPHVRINRLFGDRVAVWVKLVCSDRTACSSSRPQATPASGSRLSPP